MNAISASSIRTNALQAENARLQATLKSSGSSKRTKSASLLHTDALKEENERLMDALSSKSSSPTRPS